MKRRTIEIQQKEGHILVLVAHEPLTTSLVQMAQEGAYQIPALCARIGISKRHLRRVFEEGLGMSPKEWLQRERLVAARNMLRLGTAIKVVAADLGFATSRMFSRDFFRCYGLCPSEFQRAECPLRSVARVVTVEPHSRGHALSAKAC